jgi:UPF0716 protein FxsA
MVIKLFLAFAVIPLVELYLLIKIGHHLGAFNTILIVILTGFVGATLARMQGMKTMLRIRDSLNRGEVPTEALVDAFLIFAAGVVLLTPGFVTDLAGVAMLIPATRVRFKGWIRKRFHQWIEKNRANIVIM